MARNAPKGKVTGAVSGQAGLLQDLLQQTLVPVPSPPRPSANPTLDTQVCTSQPQSKVAGAGSHSCHAYHGSVTDVRGHYNASGVTGTCSDGCYPDLQTGEDGQRHGLLALLFPGILGLVAKGPGLCDVYLGQ